MDQHIKIVAVLHIVMASLAVLLGIALLGILLGAGIISGDRTAALVTGGVGVALGGFFIVLAIPGYIAAWGLLNHREWARILTIVLSCFHLLSIPIGTIIGAYSLWVLLQDQSRSWFAATSV